MTGVGWCVKKYHFEKEQSINDKIFCIKKVTLFILLVLMLCLCYANVVVRTRVK